MNNTHEPVSEREKFQEWHKSQFGGTPTPSSTLCSREWETWMARQPEINALRAECSKLQNLFSQLKTAHHGLMGELIELKAERDELQSGLNIIAAWDEGQIVKPSFDEPCAAQMRTQDRNSLHGELMREKAESSKWKEKAEQAEAVNADIYKVNRGLVEELRELQAERDEIGKSAGRLQTLLGNLWNEVGMTLSYAQNNPSRAPETPAEVEALMDQMKRDGVPMGTSLESAKAIVAAALNPPASEDLPAALKGEKKCELDHSVISSGDYCLSCGTVISRKKGEV